jgi:hypothetical protein
MKETKEKELMNTLFAVCVLSFITFIICGSLINDNKRLKESNEHYKESFTIILAADSALRDSMYNTNQVDLILRSKITGKDERELKNNHRYIELITK